MGVQDATKGSSNRGFGYVFAAFFLTVAALPLLQGAPWRRWSLVTAGIFLVVSIIAPAMLAPLYRVWSRFGLLLNRITSPIALGLLFHGVVMPTGLIMRALGKDPLRLRMDPQAHTYWIERTPPGPAPESLKNQF